MKAIQIKEFGGPEVLEFSEIVVPAISHDDVLVKLYAAGVNPNDAYVRVGNYAFLIPELPYTPDLTVRGLWKRLGAMSSM